MASPIYFPGALAGLSQQAPQFGMRPGAGFAPPQQRIDPNALMALRQAMAQRQQQAQLAQLAPQLGGAAMGGGTGWAGPRSAPDQFQQMLMQPQPQPTLPGGYGQIGAGLGGAVGGGMRPAAPMQPGPVAVQGRRKRKSPLRPAGGVGQAQAGNVGGNMLAGAFAPAGAY